MAAKALAEDELGVGDVEGGMDSCAFGVLDDMFGPEGLGAIEGVDFLVGSFVDVGFSEGDVLGRMPVLGEDDVVKLFCNGVDDGDYGVAVCDG